MQKIAYQKSWQTGSQLLLVSLLLFSMVVQSSPLFFYIQDYQKNAFRENNIGSLSLVPQKVEAKELVGNRTANSKTFEKDGKGYIEVHSDTINYKDDKGQWQPINNNLVSSSISDYSYQNAGNKFKTFFKSDLQTDFFKIEQNDYSLSLSLDGANKVSAVINNNDISYKNALPNIDLHYSVDNDMVKEDIILTDKPEVKNISYTIKTSPNVKLQKDSSSNIQAITDKGELIWQMARPSVINKFTGDPMFGQYELSNLKTNQYTINLPIIDEFLPSPEIGYPVIIDPTLSIIGGTQNAYVLESGVEQGYTHPSPVDLRVGNTEWDEARAFLKFDLSGVPAGANISNATLGITCNEERASVPKIEAKRVISRDWNESEITWLNQPTIDTNPESSYVGNTAWSWWNFDITDMTKKWVQGTYPNFGLALVGHDKTISRRVFLSKYYNSNGAYRPYIKIDYTLDGSTPTKKMMGIQPWWKYSTAQLDEGNANINLANGNLALNYQDLSVGGLGFDTIISHTYNSQENTDSRFGYNWTISANKKMIPSADKKAVIYKDETGTEFTFYDTDGNGNYVDNNEYDPSSGSYTRTDHRPNGLNWGLKYDSISHQFKSISNSKITYTFDESGKILSETDRNNNTLNYEYNVNQLIAIRNNNSASAVKLYYDNYDRLERIEDLNYQDSQYKSSGQKILYTYDNGDLMTVSRYASDTLIGTTKYSYSNHQLVSVTDPKNNLTQFISSSGKVTDVIDATSKKTTISYQPSVNSQTGLTKVISAKGNETGTNPADFTTSYYFSTNPSFQTGLPLKEISVPLKTDTNPTPLPQTTEYNYNDDYKLTGVTDPTGAVDASAYDDFSGLLTYQYSKLKILTLKNTYNYGSFENGDWRLIDSYDGNGVQTSFGYEPKGNLVKKSIVDGDQINYLHNGGFETATRRADKWDSYCGSRSITNEQAGDYWCSSGTAVVANVGDYRTRGIDNTTSTDGTNSQWVGINGETRAGKSSNVYQAIDETTKTTASTIYTLSFQYKLDNNQNIKLQVGEDSIDTFGHMNYGTQLSSNIIDSPRDGQWHPASWQFTTRGDNSDSHPYWTSNIYLRIINTNLNGVVANGKIWFDSVKLQKGTLLDKQVEKFSKFEYNSVGQVTKETTPEGKIINYEWDQNGNIRATVDPLGNRTEFTYDANGNKLTSTEPKGTATLNDLSDYKTVFTYNSSGQITSTTEAKTNNKTTYNYDANGNLQDTITPNGLKNSIQYDALNRPQTTVNAYGFSSKVEYDANGNPKGITDPNKKTSSTSYDPADRVIQEIDPAGKTTETKYDVNDQVKVLSVENQTLSYNYDKDGRPTGETFNNAGVVKSASYAYDKADNVIQSTMPTNDTITPSYTLTNEISKISIGGTIAKYTRNKNNQLTKVDKQVDANGNPTGDSTTYQYNDAGQVTDIIHSKNGTNFQTYHYEFDANGNRKQVVTNGQTTIYEYDNLNQISKSTTPDGKITQYSYDKGGNLREIIYPNKTRTVFSYDGNRLVKKNNPDNTVEYYGYDSNGNITSRDSGESIPLISHFNGDAKNLRDRQSGLINDDNKIIPTYTSGKIGQALQLSNNQFLTYSSSSNFSKGAGTLEFWMSPNWNNDASIHTLFEYSADANNYIKLKKTADNKLQFQYVVNGKDQGTTASSATNWINGNWYHIAVTWQTNKITIYINSQKVSEKILCSPTADFCSSYLPKMTPSATKLTFGASSTSIGNSEFADIKLDELRITGTARTDSDILSDYSSNSEYALSKTTTYEYDSDDYLNKIIKPDGSILTYTYDANKRLIKRKVEGASPLETTYLYDGDKVVSETTGTDITKYLYDTAGNLLIIVKNNINYYPVYDGLGSIIGIRDSAGTTINSYNYDEWGTVTSKTEGIQNPLRFASYRWDKDANMYLLGARWYDPTLNRFVSVDPQPGSQDDSISQNEYIYCRNNPINFMDPDGELGQYYQYALAGGGTLGAISSAGIGAAAVAAAPGILIGIGIVAGLGLAYLTGRQIGKAITKANKKIDKIKKLKNQYQLQGPKKRGKTLRLIGVKIRNTNHQVFRIDYGPEGKGKKTFHYHQQPNMKQHHRIWPRRKK